MITILKKIAIIATLLTGAAFAQSPLDLPIPQFPDSPLILPQGIHSSVDLLTGTASHTVYISDGVAAANCPKAPGGVCGIYLGAVSGSPATCSGCSLIAGGAIPGANTLVPLETIESAWDGTYWDVWVVHGSWFDDLNRSQNNPWIWTDYCYPSAAGACTPATGYLSYHSDCIASNPCPIYTLSNGTNDYGYNPRGRQVCTHGGMEFEQLSASLPPLPNMGHRNRYCDGSVLGYPATNAPIPATSSAYPVTNCAANASLPCTPAANPYNDLANMWTISSSSTGGLNGSTLGAVVQMAAAHTSTSHCLIPFAFLISSFTGSSGSLTFTIIGTNNPLWVGQYIYLSGFTSPNTGLNGQTAEVTATTGPGGQTFTVNVTGSGYSSGAGETQLNPFCPNDGVSHHGIQDVRFYYDSNSINDGIRILDISSIEWSIDSACGNCILPSTFLSAAPHDIFFDEDFVESDADEDGFGVNLIASALNMSGVNISVNHSTFEGIKRDSTEGHTLNASAPGPYQFSDDWCEGNSICIWGGGGSLPAVYGLTGNPLLTANTERARSTVSDNPRWAPSPAGIQADTGTLVNWSCTGGNTLTLTTKGSVGAQGSGIYNPVVYVAAISAAGITSYWYTATNTTVTGGQTGITPGRTITISTACTNGSGSTSVGFAGFESTTQNNQPIVVTSAAAMNARNCGNATVGTYVSPCNPVKLNGSTPAHMNPVWKNPVEFKEGQYIYVDGEIWQYSPADGQEGQGPTFTVRACSGVAKCIGGQNQNISNFIISNVLMRHTNNGFSISARSGDGSLGCWSDTGALNNTPICNTIITVTGFTGASGTLSFTNTGKNGFSSGDSIYLAGFLAPNTGLNGQLVTVGSGGLSNTTFEATVSGSSYCGTGGGGCNGAGVAFEQPNSVLTSVVCDNTTGNTPSTYGTAIDFKFNTQPNLQSTPGGMPGTDTYIYNVGSDLASALPNGWYQSFQGELSNGPYNLVIPVFLPTGSCTPGHVYSTQGTVIGKDNGDGGGITPGMFHGVHSNIFMYDIGNHQNWNSSGGTYSIENGSSGNNFGGNFVMGPVTLANGCVALAGQACATISAINSCPAATYPPNGTDCPLVLQAQIGDIMNVQCNSTATGTGGNPEFFTTGVLSSSGSPSTFGAYIISLDTVNQQWFTYVPSFAGGTPAAGATAQCELELPQTLPYYNGASGIYNGESYPKTQFFNHVSSVGMFGAYVYGSAFETNLSFLNGLAIVPGASDTCVPGIGAGTCAGTDAAGTGGTQTCGGSIRCGFAFNQSDSYTGSQCGGPGTNVTGITNGGDPGTLTFQSYGIGARTLANYPWWSGGATPPSCTSYFANMNSVPINAATSGTSGVQCSQSANGNPPLVACTTVNALAGYIYPTSVGFVGSLNTTVYPINASGFASPYTNDFRGYVLDNSSPYKAGGMFQASDGLDNNFILSYFLNANARSVRPTWILSNYPNGGTTTYTYYPDGPQYAWMTWTATSSPYSIYENGTSCGSPGTIVGTTSNTYYQAYGLPNTGSFYWIVKDSTGACLTISGEPLTSQIAYMSAGSPIALPVQPPTGLQILNNNGFVESNNGSIQ